MSAARFARRLSKVPKCERTYCPRDIDRKILFGIMSRSNNDSVARRDVIRRSFIRQIKEYPQATYTFVLCRPQNNDADPIQREADSNHDIMFLGHLSDNKPASKAVEWLKRVIQDSHSEYKWVVIVDEGSFVQVLQTRKICCCHIRYALGMH